MRSLGKNLLVEYLNDNFLTIEQLVKLTNIDERTIRLYQKENMMPLASYKLDISVNCKSFTGKHIERQSSEYYAKGYVSWLSTIHSLKSEKWAFKEFSNRYNHRLNLLRGPVCDTRTGSILLDWERFLHGTYGLCTSTGLPEQIATKAFVTEKVKALIKRESLDVREKEELRYFVNLLDNACSYFAPYERLTSTRYLLIDCVRRKYELEE